MNERSRLVKCEQWPPLHSVITHERKTSTRQPESDQDINIYDGGNMVTFSEMVNDLADGASEVVMETDRSYNGFKTNMLNKQLAIINRVCRQARC